MQAFNIDTTDLDGIAHGDGFDDMHQTELGVVQVGQLAGFVQYDGGILGQVDRHQDFLIQTHLVSPSPGPILLSYAYYSVCHTSTTADLCKWLAVIVPIVRKNVRICKSWKDGTACRSTALCGRKRPGPAGA